MLLSAAVTVRRLLGFALTGLLTATACQGRIGDASAPGANPPSGNPATPPVVRPREEPPLEPGTLDVPLSVKEVAGTGASGFPVTAVVPLPRGAFTTTENLRISDPEGRTVPAQLEVLNKHWADDGSIRHVLVHFQPVVDAFSGAGSGVAIYRLQDNGPTIAPPNPVRVEDGASAIVLDSGAVQLRIEKRPFRIVTPRGELRAVLHDHTGAEQRSFDAENVTLEIEERGPMRATIRAESPAVLTPSGIRHGWAVRIYAYAGKPYVKVDYKLQNSAKNETFSRPLFFDQLRLELPTAVAGQARAIRAERIDTNPVDRDPGVLDTGALQVVLRHFWEKLPNGLAVDEAGTLSVELFPSWGAKPVGSGFSESGLHWLNDMQHVMKEVLLNFEPYSADELSRLARTFQFHPVVTLPVEWYARTQVTLDMGGYFAVSSRITEDDRRKPNYVRYNQDEYDTLSWPERFGWAQFGVDFMRKNAPATTGSWPYSVSRYFLTENPADYYAAEDFALGELDAMPQWIAQYSYQQDFQRLQLSENPYSGTTWRRFDGSYGYDPLPGYLPDTFQDAKPRDDQHGWFYHVEEAYYITGNPWIRDWYEFVAEFRKTRLNQRDPYPDMSARATGHALAHALQAHRVTGDAELLALTGNYLKNHVAPLIDPVLGGFKPRMDYPQEAVFQIGFLARAMISYLEELPESDPTALELVAGFVRWNVGYANFGYYNPLTERNTTSDGSAMTFGDPQAWYAVATGDQAALEHLRTYVERGIGGGARPYVDLAHWTGDFNGRISSAALSE